MRIISWNANSIRARIDSFLYLIKTYTPDIILLQETRVDDPIFPYEYFEDHGYNLAIKGQKGRNGVAICSKHIIENIDTSFCEEEARYIEAFTGGIFVSSVYVPNGQEVNAPQYFYKLEFLKKLADKFRTFKEEIFIAGGDFNVGPYPKDIYIRGYDGIAGTDLERSAIAELRNEGYTDILEDKGFTWWSYRQRGFKKNNGFRLDHFYLSQPAMKLYKNCDVLVDVRQQIRPSDHAPILCDLEI